MACAVELFNFVRADCELLALSPCSQASRQGEQRVVMSSSVMTIVLAPTSEICPFQVLRKDLLY